MIQTAMAVAPSRPKNANGPPTTSAANAASQCNLADPDSGAPATGRIYVRSFAAFASAAASVTVQLRISGTVIMDFGTLSLTVAAQVFQVGILLHVGPGLTPNLLVGAGGAGVTTTVSVAAEFADPNIASPAP